MKQFNYTITDALGIHARPAGMLAKAAKMYADTEITISCNGKTAKAAQLMKIMGLGVKKGHIVTVMAEGIHEEAAIAAMDGFFTSNL